MRLSAELPQHSKWPLLVIPHVCRLPALSLENVSSGTVAWPSVFEPQHEAVPVTVSAQECFPPDVTSAQFPAVGGVVCPDVLRPQQLSVSVRLTAHEWSAPTLSRVNAPLGAAVLLSAAEPQHVILPLPPPNAQVCELPAETCATDAGQTGS